MMNFTFVRCSKLLRCVCSIMISWLFVFTAHSAEISDSKLKRIIEQTAKKTAEEVLKEVKQQSGINSPGGITPQNNANVSPAASSSLEKIDTNSQLMTIGSGAVGGNYFVLGELVGGVISHPKGSLPCGAGGTCGVNGVQTLNITSAGSMENLIALEAEKIDSGFVQSDVAYWAYTGTGAFENKEKMSHIRAIASLYPEAVHIVINKKANILTIEDLKNKRVSIGARKSGTISQARLVLNAYSMGEDDLQVQYLNNQHSIQQLKAGNLDAMFFSVGSPAPALTQLFSESNDFTLLSIDKAAQKKIFKHGSYFSPFTIKSGVYQNVPNISTISVFALWLSSENQDDELIYEMTKALWSDTSRQLFDSSFIGRQVTVENSLKGIGIPLHEGAKKYYNEIGKRF